MMLVVEGEGESCVKVCSQREVHYRGVRKKPWGTYTAQIRERRKKRRVSLGTFDTNVEAALAYDRAAVILRGPKAITNFPIPIDRLPPSPSPSAFPLRNRDSRTAWTNAYIRRPLKATVGNTGFNPGGLSLFLSLSSNSSQTVCETKIPLTPQQLHQGIHTAHAPLNDGNGLLRVGSESSNASSSTSRVTDTQDFQTKETAFNNMDDKFALGLNTPLRDDGGGEGCGAEHYHDSSCRTLWLIDSI